MILFATVAKSFFFSSNIRQFFREVEVLIDAVPQVEEEMQESVSAARGSAKQDSERIKARLDLQELAVSRIEEAQDHLVAQVSVQF